ncbi:MAG: type I glyceraldehyde-3-phosphate dehydrogenase [Sulfobacillus thermosulfidooxidans]|nr:MAG: type I glyceraldehyde-3-phosphate dehydrogenase [Sulfobacillus thermosulfidooxidans]
MVKVGINGFGSIGRQFFRLAHQQRRFDIVAINDQTDAATLAHLLTYDSNYGRFHADVVAAGRSLRVDDHDVHVFSEHNAGAIPWGPLGVDIVIEASGRYTDGDLARAHIERAGAQKVIITAPAVHEDLTVVLGVNEEEYRPWKHQVLSMSSCTTNCAAPVAKVLDETFGLETGLMTTIHAYTNDQKLMDSPYPDWRLARAAAQNIIPAGTGAAQSFDSILPRLKGRLNGVAMRVPISAVSVVDLTIHTRYPASVSSVNEAFRLASSGLLKGIMQYSELPLVSMDFKGNPHSAIVDGTQTLVVGEHLVKTMAWYDNEWAYAQRLVDLTVMVAERDGWQ